MNRRSTGSNSGAPSHLQTSSPTPRTPVAPRRQNGTSCPFLFPYPFVPALPLCPFLAFQLARTERKSWSDALATNGRPKGTATWQQQQPSGPPGKHHQRCQKLGRQPATNGTATAHPAHLWLPAEAVTTAVGGAVVVAICHLRWSSVRAREAVASPPSRLPPHVPSTHQRSSGKAPVVAGMVCS